MSDAFEHHLAFVLPGAPKWWMALGHTSKLAPLLVLYAAALAARRRGLPPR